MRNAYVRGFLEKLAGPLILDTAYRANALYRGARPLNMIKGVARDASAAPDAVYNVAEIAQMGGHGLSKLAPHLSGPAAQTATSMGKNLVQYGKPVGTGAWAVSQGVNFASMGLKDPKTGKWFKGNVRENLTGNVNKELAESQGRMQRHQANHGKPWGAVTGTAANAWNGFMNPGRTIVTADAGLQQTRNALRDSIKGMGWKNTWNAFRGKGVAAPTQEELQQHRAKLMARRQQMKTGEARMRKEYIDGFMDKLATSKFTPEEVKEVIKQIGLGNLSHEELEFLGIKNVVLGKQKAPKIKIKPRLRPSDFKPSSNWGTFANRLRQVRKLVK